MRQDDSLQWVGYKRLGDEYPHAVIDPARGEYVIGAVHTNTIEGFWSIFKRGVVGTYHKVSRKYLPLYVPSSNSAITIAETRTFLKRRLPDAEAFAMGACRMASRRTCRPLVRVIRDTRCL